MGALRQRAAQRNTAAWERLGGTHPDEETPSEAYARLRLEMLDAERGKVLKVRSTGTIPHEVVEDVLVALDVEESMLDVRNERLAELEGAETVSGVTGTTYSCEHLDVAPRDVDSDPSADAGRSARTASRTGSPTGCTCASACPAATWPAATPRRGGTPACTSSRPTTP